MRVVGGGLGEALSDVVVLATVVGLVVGKASGCSGGTWAVSRFTRARLDDDLAWSDVAGLSLLAGVGFTVSLLIGELAYGPGSPRDEHVKLAVLLASLLAALLAAVVLRRRNRHYRLVEERESLDDDGDGVPDVYQRTRERRLSVGSAGTTPVHPRGREGARAMSSSTPRPADHPSATGRSGRSSPRSATT